MTYRREALIAEPPWGTAEDWDARASSPSAIRLGAGRLTRAARALVLAVASYF
jgi:hypothetical protein